MCFEAALYRRRRSQARLQEARRPGDPGCLRESRLSSSACSVALQRPFVRSPVGGVRRAIKARSCLARHLREWRLVVVRGGPARAAALARVSTAREAVGQTAQSIWLMAAQWRSTCSVPWSNGCADHGLVAARVAYVLGVACGRPTLPVDVVPGRVPCRCDACPLRVVARSARREAGGQVPSPRVRPGAVPGAVVWCPTVCVSGPFAARQPAPPPATAPRTSRRGDTIDSLASAFSAIASAITHIPGPRVTCCSAS